MPLLPCRFHVRGEPISVLPPVPIAVIGLPKLAGIGWPDSLFNSGLGSNRSIWLGPPSIKSQMTDFAFTGKCVFFGVSAPSANMLPSAMAPSPLPAREKNSRRFETFQ